MTFIEKAVDNKTRLSIANLLMNLLHPPLGKWTVNPSQLECNVLRVQLNNKLGHGTECGPFATGAEHRSNLVKKTLLFIEEGR